MTREEQINIACEAMNYPDPEYSEDGSASAFVEGAKWADWTMIDKACKWLLEHTESHHNYYGNHVETDAYETPQEFIERFKKAMEQ